MRLQRTTPVEGKIEVLAVGEVQRGGLDQLPLGVDAFAEHDELQLEKDNLKNGGRPRSAQSSRV